MESKKWNAFNSLYGDAVKNKRPQDFHVESLCNIDVLFSQLISAGSITSIAWSSQGVLAFAPSRLLCRSYSDRTHDSSKASCAGGTYANYGVAVMVPRFNATEGVSQFTKPTPIPQASVVHSNSDIQHLSWNQKGTNLATVDELGRIGIWSMGSVVNQWNCILNLDMGMGIVSFEWLKTDREYYGNTIVRRSEGAPRFGHRFKKRRLIGPRSFFGQNAFIFTTVNGDIQLWYQPEGRTFQCLSCNLPKSAFPISHGSMAVGSDGTYILTIHRASQAAKILELYELNIQFFNNPLKGITCRLITTVQIGKASEPLHGITNDANYPYDLLARCPITHLRAIHADGKKGYRIIVAVSEKTDSSHFLCPEFVKGIGYHTLVAVFELSKIGFPISTKFRELAHQKIHTQDKGGTNPSNSVVSWNCSYVAGCFYDWGLLTTLMTNGKDIVFGFCNGRIDFRDIDGLEISKAEYQIRGSDTIDGIVNCGFSFSGVPAPNCCDQDDYAVMGIACSPNGTALIVVDTSGKMELTSVADRHPSEDDIQQDTPILIAVLARMFSTAILNSIDHSDLVDVCLRLGQYVGKKDFIEDVLEALYAGLDTWVRDESDGFNLANKTPNSAESSHINGLPSFLGGGPVPGEGISTLQARMNHVQMSLYRATDGKDVLYANTFAMIQLRINVDAFRDSCMSDSSKIKTIIEDGVAGTLDFRPTTVWPLVGISTWTIDFCAFLIRDLHIFFSRYPEEGNNGIENNYSSDPPHFVMLIQNGARRALQSVLRFINQLERWAADKVGPTPNATSNEDLTGIASFTGKYLRNAKARCPVNLEVMLRFIEQLDAVVEQAFAGLTVSNHAIRERRIAVRGHVPHVLRIGLFQTLRNAFESQSDLYDRNALYFYDISWLGLYKGQKEQSEDESVGNTESINGTTPRRIVATPSSSMSHPSPAFLNGTSKQYMAGNGVTTSSSTSDSKNESLSASAAMSLNSIQSGQLPQVSGSVSAPHSNGATPLNGVLDAKGNANGLRAVAVDDDDMGTNVSIGIHSTLTTDVIRKQRMEVNPSTFTDYSRNTVNSCGAEMPTWSQSIRQCIKCGQLSTISPQDFDFSSKEIGNSSVWHDAFSRTCICGGMWIMPL